MEAEIGGMRPQAKEHLEPPDTLVGSPLPGSREGAPSLVPASVGSRSQPSAIGESPRNGTSVGPWNLRLVSRSRPGRPSLRLCSTQSDRCPLEDPLTLLDRPTTISDDCGES